MLRVQVPCTAPSDILLFMSKQSEKVKRWRKSCKARIVEAMGGKCSICGYLTCNDALSLHHLNPVEKDFSFAGIRANPKSWDSIVIELRKCILVCHNCHSEIHAGIKNIPESIYRFNESYSDYRAKNKNMNSCPICGSLKNDTQKFCSTNCVRKSLSKINLTYDDLLIELRTKSVPQLSKEIGCSSTAIYNKLKNKMHP